MFKRLFLAIFIFSIPICVQAEEVQGFTPKPFLGIAFEAVPSFNVPNTSKKVNSLKVLMVLNGTSAEKYKLQTGDYILSYDNKVLPTPNKEVMMKTFKDYLLDDKKIGQELKLKIYRENKVIKEVFGTTERQTTWNITDLEKRFAIIKPNEEIQVKLLLKTEFLTLVPKLGQKTFERKIEPSSNAEIFPHFEGMENPVEDICKNLIQTSTLTKNYKEILADYKDDEWWDDGFRLKLIRYVHRDPFKLMPIANKITERIVQESDFSNYAVISTLAELLDEKDYGICNEIKPNKSLVLEEHYEYIQNVLNRSEEYRELAFKTFSQEEINYYYEHFFKLTDRLAKSYYLNTDTKDKNYQIFEKLLSLIKKVNFKALNNASEVLFQLADKDWLLNFEQALENADLPTPNLMSVDIRGDVLAAKAFKQGLLIVGGKKSTYYRDDVAFIIDLGGNDIYYNNAGGSRRKFPVSLVIDLKGQDQYSSTEPIAQGSGFFGVGMLVDFSGNDIYMGKTLSQGVGIFGVGILQDIVGADEYYGQEYHQGFGFAGIGILKDVKGDDIYHATGFAQGVGCVKGAGLLLDKRGNDKYQVLGKQVSSYGTKGIFRGSGQGFGIGFRNMSSGGMGILLDVRGEDTYTAGNFSQGAGYFYGMGILRDFGASSDKYTCMRYGQGAAAHYAEGVFIEDGGNDKYIGFQGAVQGAAWDRSCVVFWEKQGNDIYKTDSLFFSNGAADNNGFAIFLDQKGKDQYNIHNRSGEVKNDYHDGYSLSFFLDLKGKDKYFNNGFKNNYQNSFGNSLIFFDIKKLNY
jgi:hypothetical protein